MSKKVSFLQMPDILTITNLESELMMGTIMVVKGMLSTKPEVIPDTQTMTKMARGSCAPGPTPT